MLSILLFILSLSSQAQENVVDQAEPLPFYFPKTETGELIYVTQTEAIAYCQDPANVQQPAHLPTAREMAEFGQSRGAEGILDNDAEVDVDFGFEALTVEVDGSSDSFIYSKKGYVTPEQEFTSNIFWTSSHGPTPDSAITFRGGESYGFLGYQYDKFPNAILCVLEN